MAVTVGGSIVDRQLVRTFGLRCVALCCGVGWHPWLGGQIRTISLRLRYVEV
jgi:hypothetical protein